MRAKGQGMTTKHLELPEALLTRIDATVDRLFAATGTKPRRSHVVAFLIQLGLDVSSAEPNLTEFFNRLGKPRESGPQRGPDPPVRSDSPSARETRPPKRFHPALGRGGR